MDDSELHRREQAKREAAWDPAERWRVVQQTITWAEQQATARRNTPAECKRLERQKLASLPE